jgi:hypothetical protein
MRHSRLAGFFMAIGVKAVLDLVSGGRGARPRRARRARRRERAAVRAPAGETPPRPARAAPALALLAVGAITLLLFDSTATRVIGVLALFGFVVAGVFAIADPRWLGSSPELGQTDPAPSAARRAPGASSPAGSARSSC